MDDEPEDERSSQARTPPAETPKPVAVFYDLATRDGRRAVEIRTAEPLGSGYLAPARRTLYSCSYTTQTERILAFRRARAFCDERGHAIVHMGSAADCRAAWQ